jgi:hypothetical protein
MIDVPQINEPTLVGALIIALVAFVRGIIRVGTLEDAQKLALIEERNAWRDQANAWHERSLTSDARLDRMATLFEEALNGSQEFDRSRADHP